MFKRVVSLFVLLAVLFSISSSFALEIESSNPVLTPYKITKYTKTKHDIVNVCLIGIDYGFKGYRASAWNKKRSLEDCHADAVMVVAIDRTDNKVSLISFPRDTLVYVPGVRGIYKLNNSFNCASTAEEGAMRVCDSVSWLLGNIRVDKYVAVDMKAVVVAGDAIGGVDFDVDMSYIGHSGTYYKKGKQHLDGMGIMDYIRARKNASVDASDMGRTERGRRMINALFDKVQKNPELVSTILALLNNKKINMFTNISNDELASLAQTGLNINLKKSGSYMMVGKLQLEVNGGWNTNFTNTANRKSLIKEVYGVSVKNLKYTSYKYITWFYQKGAYSCVRMVNIAKKVYDYAEKQNLTADQKKQLKAIGDAITKTVAAFDKATDSMAEDDYKAMNNLKNNTLKPAVDKLASTLKLPFKIQWNYGEIWTSNDMVFEYADINWN